MADAPYFNLVDESWIQVLDLTGRRTEVSLRDAFTQADRLGELVGEVPTQSFANLRLLLAIAYRAFAGPQDVDDWTRLAADWDEAMALVDGYLDLHHERFWLAHDPAPFFQVADLHTAKGEVSGLEKLIADVPNGLPFLTTRLGRSLRSIGWAEAARWLVHVHAYDPAGIRSGALGDPRVKNGKGYPIGTGWAGQLGGVHAMGDTLRETLMLNLVPQSQLAGARRDDAPPWERDPLTAAPDLPPGVPPGEVREPRGPVDLYTWQSRRVRLVGSADGVTGVVLAQGDKSAPQNRFTVEPLSAWRYSEPQTKRRGARTYMPLTHDPSRALWRGLSAYLPAWAGMAGSGSRPAPRRPPALTEWLERLTEEERLSERRVVLRAVGIEYGSNSSVVDDLVDDRLVLPAALLSSVDLSMTVDAALVVAEEAVRILAALAKNVALAAGASADADGPRDLAREQAYAWLDGLFRVWVGDLWDPGRHVTYLSEWRDSVRSTVLSVADVIVSEAGPAARAGREVHGRHLDAGLAELWFRRRIADLLPRPEQVGAGAAVEQEDEEEGL
jgi:CRISPR system Cascade subunit CasA